MASETVTPATDRSDGGAFTLLSRVAVELDARSSTAQVVVEMLDDLVNENATGDPDPSDPRGHTQRALALVEGIRGQLQQLQRLVNEIDQFRAQELAHG